MAAPTVKREPIFEDIFELIGHCGLTQICLYVLGCIIETAVSLSVLFFSLESVVPGWTCQSSNVSGETPLPTTGSDFYATSGNVTENVCPGEGITCENITYKEGFASIATEWDLICERRYIGRLTASLYFLGVLVGSILCGYLSDTFGRKRTILAMWLCLITFQTCSGFAPIWAAYLPLRILAGVFAGGCATVALILPMEFLGPKYRMITSNRIGWQLGGLTSALLGYLTRRWQYTAMGSGLLTLPVVPLFAIFMPESARWLIQKGRVKEAGRWIKMIAKYNRRPPPDLSILDDIAKSEQAKQQSKETYSYVDLFRTRKYAVRSLVLILGWFDVAFVSYGIGADVGSLTGSIYLNIALLNLGMLSFRWTAIPVANKIGRRKAYFFYKFSFLLCLVVVMSLAVTDADKYGAAITGLVIFSMVFQAGIWAMVFIYASESFPTLLRTRAAALGNMANRLSGIIAPQVGLLAVYHKAIPYILYLVLGTITLILFFCIMPETKDKPLPEDLPQKKHRKGRTPGKEDTKSQKEEVEMIQH